MIRTFFIGAWALVFSLNLMSQERMETHDQADSADVQEKIAILRLSPELWEQHAHILTWDLVWKYHPGDDPRWALPGYDDASWEPALPTLRRDNLPKEGWPGVGWFRLHVVVDSTVPNTSFGITGSTEGAIGVYWDGVLQTNRLPFRFPDPIVVGGPGHHLLAVRYERADIESVHADGHAGGFFLSIGEFHNAFEVMIHQKAEQMFFVGLMLAIGIIHLMLFAFSPSSKGNLYYAVSLFAMAASVYLDVQQAYLSETGTGSLGLLVAHRAVVPFTIVFFLRFMYSIFYPRCPWYFWLFAGLMTIVAVIIVLNPQRLFYVYVYASTIVTIEMIRVLVVAIRGKKPGAWIIAGGFILVGIFSAYDTLLDLEIMGPINQITNAYYFGFAGLLAAMSIYLARDFARTTQRLIDQVKRTHKEEMARRLVEADNERKTKELDDARQLQLSMLPACRNDIPGLDICFHMDTATEVGGDYYDYFHKDDTLTIAVGDATGHGMKAGTMVSIIKSLFITHAPHDDLPAFLRKCADAIKHMMLGNLYMGLTMVRIRSGRLEMTSAGMPPAYVYRAATGSVDEFVIKSMPLGGPAGTPFETKHSQLAGGDILLLMSDGLAEQFNPDGEILDYPRVKEAFKKTAGESATEIARSLVQKGKEWADGRAQGDDVTLVVVKVKS